MEQIVEAIEEQPGAEPIAFAYQLAGVGLPAPDSDASVILRPDRDDPRCRVPAPEPLVFVATHGHSLGEGLHCLTLVGEGVSSVVFMERSALRELHVVGGRRDVSDAAACRDGAEATGARDAGATDRARARRSASGADIRDGDRAAAEW